jgi:hypothetical protein
LPPNRHGLSFRTETTCVANGEDGFIGSPVLSLAMTLVLTAVNAACVVQASDRLLTTWRGSKLIGAHDQFANKTVIFLASDGVMTISYAGQAYIGSEPTDDWIARQLAGSPPRRTPDGRVGAWSFERLPSRKFNQACWLLQTAIESEPQMSGRLELSIGGWRNRRNRLTQVALGIEKSSSGVERRGHMKACIGHFGEALHSVGVDFDPAVIRAVAGETLATKAATPEAVLLDAKVRSGILAEAIRRTSATNPGVGADVMLVEISRWPQTSWGTVTIRFRPCRGRYAELHAGQTVTTVPAAFWPWVVTPGGKKAPTVSTGGGASEFHMGGWRFVFDPEGATTPATGSFSAESSIRRPPPPGKKMSQG